MHLYTIVENQPIEKKGTFQNTIKESYIGIGGVNIFWPAKEK